MSFASRLKVEGYGMLLTAVFYGIAGIVFLALLFLTNFPPHIGILAMFSLVTAYGMIRKRTWTIWPVVILFFSATTFSVYMLYYSLGKDYLQGIGTLAYLILTWIFTAYAIDRRKKLED